MQTAQAATGEDSHVERARELLARLWPPTASIRDIEYRLCAGSGCTYREASILIAERAAADRIALRGLNPASAREAAEAILHR